MHILGQARKRLLLLPCFFLVCATTMSSLMDPTYARAEVLLVEDFEDPAKSLALWSASNPTVLNVVIDPKKARFGSGVLELVYWPNTTGPGFFAPKQPWSPRSEIYVRWYEKYSSNWVWSGNGQKILFINRGAGSIVPGLLLRSMWGGDQPRVGFDMGVDLPDLVQNVTGKGLGDGQWHCLEWYVKAGSSGTIKLWIDGELTMDHSALPFTFGAIDGIMPSAYYNEGGATPSGVPQLQYRWIDDLAVSTARIGCLPDSGDKTPPSAPSGLRLTLTGE